MNKSARYKIIPNGDGGGIMVFDSETGAIQYPICREDIVACHNRLVRQGRIDESQELLAESMVGSTQITKLVKFLAVPSNEDHFYR